MLIGMCHEENIMMMGFGFIFSLAFLVLIIGLAIWGITYLFPDISDSIGARRSPHDSPLDILKQRYARGEISRGEYDEMRHTLHAE
jgi:putative membrane protein